MSNVPNSSLQITIVGGHNINTVLDETIYQAVIGICSLVVTFDSLESRVFGYPQCESVFRAELFEFCQNTIGHDRDTFGIKTIHHCWDHLEFVLDGVGDEIGVNQN